MTQKKWKKEHILHIWDCQWASIMMNSGHWLIQTQAWAISEKDWNMAFFQWCIARYVRKKIGMCKFWGSLHSRNASFDGGWPMWRRNRISPNTTKGPLVESGLGRLVWIRVNGYFRSHFKIVCVKQIVRFPPEKSRCYEKKSGEVLNGRTFRSKSDIFATRARGSCGVDPRPV